MAERRDSAPDPEWIPAVTDLCFRGYIPLLSVEAVWNGLNLPDVELDALCESICANLEHQGSCFNNHKIWHAVLNGRSTETSALAESPGCCI